MGRPHIDTANYRNPILGGSNGSLQNLTLAARGSFSIAAVTTNKATTPTETNTNSKKGRDRKSRLHSKRRRQHHRDEDYTTAIFEGRELVVVTDVEPVRESFQEPDVIVLAEVIPEDHPSHSSSPQTKTRALYERWEQQQRYSKNRNTSILLTSDHLRLNRMVVKTVLLLVSIFTIALYLENTRGNGSLWFPLILTGKNRPHRGTTTTTTRHHTLRREDGMAMDKGGSHRRKKNQKSKRANDFAGAKRDGRKQKYQREKLNDFMFPDASGIRYRFHNIGGARFTFYDINSRATREAKNLSYLADSTYDFILGVAGDTPLDSNDGKFLLCHKPITSVIRTSATDDDDGEIQELASDERRRAKKKHTAAGTPIFTEDKKALHTIRQLVAKQRKKMAAHDAARKEARTRGFFGNYDQDGYCISVTLEELRTKHHFHTHSGEFEYEKRTGSFYETEAYYDLA